jgi:hypothetical protein
MLLGRNTQDLDNKVKNTFSKKYEIVLKQEVKKDTSEQNGATTLSIMSFSITTLNIMTISIMTLSILTLSIIALSIMTLSMAIINMPHSA